MTLPRQVVPMVLREGIDTKSSTRAQVAGRLVELENGVFAKSGELRKRYGYDRIVAHVENGAAITQADGLATFRDELLLFGEHGRVHSLSGALDRWLDRGGIVSVGLEERPVVRNSSAQSSPDVARGGTMTCTVWEDSRGGVRYTITDDETGVPLVSDGSVSTTGTRPRVVSVNGAFIIFYCAGSGIFYKRIIHLDPTTLGVEQNPIATMSAPLSSFDVCVTELTTHIVWTEASSARYAYLTPGLAWNVVGAVGSGAPELIACWGDELTNVWILTSTGSTQRLEVYDGGPAVILAATVVGTVGTPLRMGGVVPAGSGSATMAIEGASAVVHRATCSLAGAASGSSVLLRSVSLYGKPFAYGGTNVYIPIAHDSTYQATTFVADAASGRIIAKAAPGLAGGSRSRNTLTHVVSTTAGAWTMAATVKTALESSAAGVFSRNGVQLVDLDFTAEARYLSVEIAKGLHIAGGVLHVYDGANLTEHGFHLYPEGVTAVAAGAGGAIEAGARQWRAVYEWTDGQGNVHRSAPSDARSITTAVNDQVTLTIPTLRLTTKSQVRIAIYRTLAAGNVFYRLNAIATPLLNDTAVDSVTYVDTASDVSITGNELLYTDGTAGQELENIAPPASSAICSHRGRVVLVTGPNRVACSKQAIDGEPVAFSDALYLMPDARGGKVTAVASMDDKLVLFKERAIFVVFGDGPNAAGSGDYSEPQLVTSDVGCTEVRSVVTTNAGLMFKSAKGIYLLDRALTVTYIGANVEDYNALSITSANNVPNTNEVRFTTSTGACLVYDYVFAQWSTFTNHESADATVWGDAYVRVRSDGKVFKENRTLFTDAGEHVKLKLTTSWLTFAGISGFQRIARVLCLGEFKSQHSFRVRLGYDYAPEFPYDQTINATTALGVGTWGSDAAWGTGAVWGGYYPNEWFRVQPQRQKCSAIRVSIEDAQTSNYGEGYSISSLAFDVGPKKGANKIAASRAV